MKKILVTLFFLSNLFFMLDAFTLMQSKSYLSNEMHNIVQIIQKEHRIGQGVYEYLVDKKYLFQFEDKEYVLGEYCECTLTMNIHLIYIQNKEINYQYCFYLGAYL